MTTCFPRAWLSSWIASFSRGLDSNQQPAHAPPSPQAPAPKKLPELHDPADACFASELCVLLLVRADRRGRGRAAVRTRSPMLKRTTERFAIAAPLLLSSLPLLLSPLLGSSPPPRGYMCVHLSELPSHPHLVLINTATAIAYSLHHIVAHIAALSSPPAMLLLELPHCFLTPHTEGGPPLLAALAATNPPPTRT
ncbi:hypothetical protein AB1Y20_004126 [Prymnesium parvum]|uniref:Mannosyltransferase n=1 Tax=Prymnesium parvum TaxID=97485 RepID=A0AB34J8U0_PRYPA